MARKYSFVTNWYVPAPLEDVWELIYQSEDWPNWWRNVKSVVETVKGDEQGIGSIRVYKMRSPFGYTLNFSLLLTGREQHKLLRGIASGDLYGTGSWQFNHGDGITHIQCRWEVSTTIWWMNLFAFMLRPLFAYNHKAVMQSGGECLARKLGVQLASS